MVYRQAASTLPAADKNQRFPGTVFVRSARCHFIQRHAQDRRLIRRPAGVGRVVNRVATLGDVRDSEYRELVDFIVVTGVVTVRGAFGAISPGSI